MLRDEAHASLPQHGVAYAIEKVEPITYLRNVQPGL